MKGLVKACVVQMDFDLSRSQAVLISNAVYEEGSGIPDLLAATNCISAMKTLLTSDLCGWPADRVTGLADVIAPSELAVQLHRKVEDAQDVLLLYYVGHGIRTARGQLALTLRGSNSHPELVPHTAMLYSAVADILRGCAATTKLVMLDCCHAELGTKENFQTQSADIEAEPVDGLYFIGASKMWENARSPSGGGLTYFTEEFIEVVKAGIPGKPPQLTIDQIFLELRSRLKRANLPEPIRSGIRNASQWPFSRNAAPAQTHRDPDEEITLLREQQAAAEAKEQALQAKIDSLMREVERLGLQVEESKSQSSTGQQRPARDLQEAQAQLQDAVEAHAAAQTESRHAAEAVDLAIADQREQGFQPLTLMTAVLPALTDMTRSTTVGARQAGEESSQPASQLSQPTALTDHRDPGQLISEWRVTVTFEDPEHGQRAVRKLHEHEVNGVAADVRQRFGSRVVASLTLNSRYLYLYVGSRDAASTVSDVVQQLIAAHNLEADVKIHYWHPVNKEWQWLTMVEPDDGELQRIEEYQELVHQYQLANDSAIAKRTGLATWEVRVDLRSHHDAVKLAHELNAAGYHPQRRWKYLLIGARNEDEAKALAEIIRQKVPPGASVDSVPIVGMASVFRGGINERWMAELGSS